MTRIKQLFDLTGKVAIVTGASRGIGESMARGLAEFGAKVVLTSRRQESVDEVEEQYKEDGLDAIAIACHVAREDDRKNLVTKTVYHFGKIDILINNAGTNPYYGPIADMPMAAYQKTMDINLNAPLELSILCFPQMKKAGGGSVIHVSSISGLHAQAGFAAYNLSKSALVMLAQNQAAEWGKDNVRVNVICPGLVKTKLSQALWDNPNYEEGLKGIPLLRMAMPDEMAGLAVFLASEASSYVSGSVIVNDGGSLHTPQMAF